VLLDHRLKQDGIDGAVIQGYANIAYTHMEVALEIFSGSADAGIGILAAAKLLGLGFVPLAKERFDLIIPAENFSTEGIKVIRQVLASEKFKVDMAQMKGYDTRDTGKIMYESR
jgi:putative molybdopterin biosynthesis protein